MSSNWTKHTTLLRMPGPLVLVGSEGPDREGLSLVSSIAEITLLYIFNLGLCLSFGKYRKNVIRFTWTFGNWWLIRPVIRHGEIAWCGLSVHVS